VEAAAGVAAAVEVVAAAEAAVVVAADRAAADRWADRRSVGATEQARRVSSSTVAA
jgi:hypothetical protein